MKLKLLICFFVTFLSVAFASDIAPLRKQLDELRAEVSQIQASSARAHSDVTHLDALLERLQVLPPQFSAFETELTPMIAQTNARLSQLGAKPKDNEQELPEITNERSAAEAELRLMEDMLKQARVSALEAEQILNQLRGQKRELTTNSLFARSNGIISFQAWQQGILEGAEHIAGLMRVSQDSISVFIEKFSTAHAVFLAILGTLLSTLPLIRRYALRIMKRVQKTHFENAPAISTLVAMAIYIAIPVLAVLAVVEIAIQLDVLPGRFNQFIQIFPPIALCVFLTRAFQFWVLTPVAKAKPLLAMPCSGGQAVIRSGLFRMGMLHSAALLVIGSRALVDPTDSTFWILQVIYSVAGLLIIYRFFQALSAVEDARELDLEAPTQQVPNWQLLMRPVLVLVFVVILVTLAMGYMTLANFVLIQSSIVLVLMILLWLVINAVEEIVAPFRQTTSSAVKRISKTTGIPDELITRSATILAGFIQLILLIAGTLLIVAIWDADRSRIFVTLAEIFSGFKVGNLQISFSAIAQSILFFVVMVAGWRWLQIWVKQKFLVHLPVEAGLKDSLDIIFGYIGLIIAFLLSFSSVGLSFENLAVIAGALSVGIGFGLQSIVNNFVSGLILLAERPIKLGDWIVVGNDEGYVRKIKVRATEIETFDKATVIVPNSTIISGSVKNWMYNNIAGRAKVKVTVKHDTDPELVKKILLTCVRSNPLVECSPEPKVFFTDMTLNGLEFDLTFMVGNVDLAHGVRSEVRMAIVEEFNKHGIEMAKHVDVR